ncbi:MAG: transglutaminase TgpA family protein [bacterium]
MADALANKPISNQLLYSLIGLLTLGVLPHFWHLPISVPGFFIATLLLRSLLWRDVHKQPGKFVLFLLTVTGIMLVIVQTGISEGRQFGVSLLVVMLGLKLLEVRTRRDIYVVVVLGYFLLITQFLFDQSPQLALYLIPLVIGLTAVLNATNRIDTGQLAKRSLTRSSKSLLLAIPVMVILFVLFPRLDGPLWSLKFGNIAKSGMSDTLSMGSVSALGLSEEPAFRVEFEGAIPPPEERYWRGIVLWETDGKNWQRTENTPFRLRYNITGEQPYTYRVTMETSGQRWLFPLDRVTERRSRVGMNIDNEVTTRKPIQHRYSYEAKSSTTYWDPDITAKQRLLGLQLPETISPRVRQLAADLRLSARNDQAVVSAALQMFNQQDFIYTLQPPLLGEDPVDEFLFETRKGFCEHYAASFVTLMRVAGIPSRLIGGYQGGEINPMGGHLLVRQADAHAWAEVWYEGEGWVRVDPTAAVAPERIQLPINPTTFGEGAPALFLVGDLSGLAGMLRNWGWLKDNMVMQWHRWIVGYDRSRQQSLLDRWGLSFLKGNKLAIAAVVLTLLIAITGFFLSQFRGKKKISPAVRAYHSFKLKLSQAGMVIPEWVGPQEIASQAVARFPDQQQEIETLVRHYISLRYGKTHSRSAEQLFVNEVRQLKLRPSAAHSK